MGGDTKKNRIRTNQPKLPQFCKNGANNNRMGRKHATNQLTQCGTNGHMSKTNETLQDQDAHRIGNKNNIRHTTTKRRTRKTKNNTKTTLRRQP